MSKFADFSQHIVKQLGRFIDSEQKAVVRKALAIPSAVFLQQGQNQPVQYLL